MSGTAPSTTPAAIWALRTVKLYRTSYSVMMANPTSISCSRAILVPVILSPAVFFHPILETQYQPTTAEKNIHVETLAKFSNGMVVLCTTSPMT